MGKMVSGLAQFIRDLWKDKKVLFELAKNDFKAKYTNSLLGIVWAFAVPLITVLVLWFVFEVQFRSAPMENVPFILWYMPAFLVWNFFTDAFGAGSGCIAEYSYLVKNMRFRVSALPIVKIISSSFVHMFFIVFIFVIYGVYGHAPRINNIQIIYYYFSLVVFLIGLTWVTSALAVFTKDTLSVVNLIVQVGFWATPIVWSMDTMPATVQNVLKLNPIFYICNGYREAFCTNSWFFQDHPLWTAYYWIFTLVLFVIGAYVFKRLRPQFADLL